VPGEPLDPQVCGDRIAQQSRRPAVVAAAAGRHGFAARDVARGSQTDSRRSEYCSGAIPRLLAVTHSYGSPGSRRYLRRGAARANMASGSASLGCCSTMS